jgi:peptidoglycan hydrolase CwlO-like protein
MKDKKNLLVIILGIILTTSIILYRKYKRAALREQQLEIQQQRAKEFFELKRKQDSIKRKKEIDSINNIKLQEFKNKHESLKDKNKQLKETMEKLKQEIEN